MDRSAAVRSVTGRVKLTIMGAATPTVWPLYGTTEATVAAVAAGAIAATLVGAVAIVAAIAMPAAARARRSDLAMALCGSLSVVFASAKIA
jgi:3-methyladenine DNA glycosylase Mpg